MGKTHKRSFQCTIISRDVGTNFNASTGHNPPCTPLWNYKKGSWKTCLN